MSAGNRIETRLRGVSLSKGCALARVCLFNEKRHSNLPMYRVRTEDHDFEIQRLDRAIRIAGERLEGVRIRVEREIGKAEAEILVAQRMILDDPSLRARVLEHVTQSGLNAEMAVSAALDHYESKMLAFDDEYMKERASDFGEIRRRLLDVLANLSPSLQCDERTCQKGKNRVIVAEELTPTLTLELDSEHVMGFMVERGGPSSHAAILARAMGIPAIGGLPGIRGRVSCGAEVLLNGDSGEVVLWPTEKTIRETCGASTSATRMPQAVPPVPGVEVLANINLAGEVGEANAMQAEGIGLYRTEFELISAGRLLTEEELTDRYTRVVQAMAGKPTVFRVVDVGSDKPLPFLSLPREDNPALGLRGLRLLRERPDLVKPQARALARAARHGPVDVLYPMIVDLEQFLEAKRLFQDGAGELAHGNLRHGVMFEVPSACLAAADILDAADFASIGTNDLFQYLFALDRNNSLVARDYRPEHPVFWRLIRSVAEAGLARGKSVSLCGEIASETGFLERILDAGIRRVSLAPKRIPAVRAAARQILAAKDVPARAT